MSFVTFNDNLLYRATCTPVFDPCNPRANFHDEVDPNTYLDNGVEKRVPFGRWTVQSVSLDLLGAIVISYGKKLYRSLNSALQDVPKSIQRFGPRCFFIVKQGTTDMSNPNHSFLIQPPDGCDPLNRCRRRKF